MVPPITRSPGCFSTGMDSPVSIDSSTALPPERTSPSTGSRSPGRTITTSPLATCSTGTSTSVPSSAPRWTRAVLGCRATSERRAAEVRLLARASRALPVRIRAMMITTAS